MQSHAKSEKSAHLIYSGSNVGFSYGRGSERTLAINNASFDIFRSDLVGLAGPSGSGKSTLLHLLGLLEHPESGDLAFCGQSVNRLKGRELDAIRRRSVGFVFQDFQLIDVLDVYENVEYFLIRQGVPAPERLLQIKEALSAVDMWDFRHRRPGKISGGQKQRVAIARALAKQPEVIIADEPTASLDAATGRDVMNLIARLNRDLGTTVIVASHDPNVLDYMKRVIHIQDGKITEDREILSHAI